jgi:hypothetical protein
MQTLEGSCHCGAVRFKVNSRGPYPYMLCYCSICRKTVGGGGYAINLIGDYDTLRVDGRENESVYHARMRENGREETSPAERHFCKLCGSALYLWDPRWPDLVHPFASAIDGPLPVPPERVHIMLESKANWVEVPDGPREAHFPEYPDLSIEDWHKSHGLWDRDES